MILAMLNQKGGVGKTTTTHNLAGALAAAGRRVLAVDADPQASLTQGLVGTQAMRSAPLERTLYAVLAGDDPVPERVVQRSPLPGIDLLPGHPRVQKFNSSEPHLDDRETRLAVRGLLAEVRGSYDFVLIDCPPNLHTCSWAALAAADAIIIPVQPEDYGAQGLNDVHDSIAAVRRSDNPRLAIMGYLLTMVSRNGVHQFYEESLRSLYGEKVFRTRISRLMDFPAAVNQRTTVDRYKASSPAAALVRELAAEVVERAGLALAPAGVA